MIEVEDLHVTFAGRARFLSGLIGKRGQVTRAVDGVSLHVQRGEIVALAGESGCGKTTLARAIVGLQAPTSGHVAFEGEPIGDVRGYRRRVQMVFQDPGGALNPRQTIYQSVAEGLRIHRIFDDEEQRVARALAQAGLRPPERFFLSYPHELSGGQCQRAVIAGALVLEPDVLIADEPVSMLDASVGGEILRLLLGLRDEFSLTMVIVTHDLGVAWTVADRVVVMYLGCIVEDGPTEEVLINPLHPYTVALLHAVPGADRRAPVLLGEPPDPTRVPSGCRFHTRCQEIASGVQDMTGEIQRCQTEPPLLIEIRPGHWVACHNAARLDSSLPK